MYHINCFTNPNFWNKFEDKSEHSKKLPCSWWWNPASYLASKYEKIYWVLMPRVSVEKYLLRYIHCTIRDDCNCYLILCMIYNTFWFATSMCHRGAINMGFCFKSKKKLKEGYKISAIQITAYIIGLSHCFSEKIAQEYREHMM